MQYFQWDGNLKLDQKVMRVHNEKYVDDENELMENANESKNADNDVKNVDQSSDEDEESFQTYVKVNFEALFKMFKEEKTIKCFYCDFCPRSKKLRDLEDEMRTHIEDKHKDVIVIPSRFPCTFCRGISPLPLNEGPLHRVFGLPPREAQP